MSFGIAKSILESEFSNLDINGVKRLRIELMGGEPMLNFPVVKKVSEWLWHHYDFEQHELCMQTNGTVLTEEAKQWLVENKERISVSCSFDGFSEMNYYNRGNRAENIGFFATTWPHVPVSITICPESVLLLHKTIREMEHRGYKYTVQPADGVRWNCMSLSHYIEQMELICELMRGDYKRAVSTSLLSYDPIDFFRPLKRETVEFCGHRRANVAYDTNGEKYFCHLFTPIALGEDAAIRAKIAYSDLAQIPFDTKCTNCPIQTYCRPCPGYRYKLRGDVNVCVEKDTICKFYHAKAYMCARYFLSEFERLSGSGTKLSDDDIWRAKKSIDYIDFYNDKLGG